MKFMAMIVDVEGTEDVDWETLMTQYAAFSEAIEAAGVYVSGEALEPISTATTVRVRDGETQITDGPFAETKEQLGGYYVLDCKDLDEAIHWAAQIPTARYGAIEVRPVMEIEEPA